MSANKYVLGISMSNHDRSVCLLRNGEVAAAVSEERIDRRKRSEGFYRANPRGIVLPPLRSLTTVLRNEGVCLDDIDLIVCGRSISTCRQDFLRQVPADPTRTIEPPAPSHHLAHAYSAYATTPWRSCAVLVIDEQGHWIDEKFERCTWFTGDSGPLRNVRRFWGTREDLSIGMFYNVFAALTGLAEAGRPAAGKLMSLAAYASEPHDWPSLLSLAPSGDVSCDLARLDAFLTDAGVPLRPGMAEVAITEVDDLLAKYSPVLWDSPLGAALARKAQDELERAVLHTATTLRETTSADSLAFAGGVALNCAVNARLAEAGWKTVHIHPAATDDGAAVGLAMYGWVETFGHEKPTIPSFDPRTGSSASHTDVEHALTTYGIDSFARPHTPPERAGELVAQGNILCWHLGRSEWGPRALGARSIVADPQQPGIVNRLNASIKFREPFRPFGISVLAEAVDDLLDRPDASGGLDRFMLSLAKPRHPGLSQVAHVDGTLRYQVVDKTLQPEWHALIHSVGQRTGLPAVINTSFNTLGEPLVESADDAVRQFVLAGADALWLEGTLLVATDITAEAWSTARKLAWDCSGLDPLSTAVSLAAAGYPDAAATVLATHSITAESLGYRGLADRRQFSALMARLAESRGVDAAIHASAVLEAWEFPSDVLHAAAILASNPHAGQDSVIGALVHALGRKQSGLAFFRRLVNGSKQPVTTSEVIG